MKSNVLPTILMTVAVLACGDKRKAPSGTSSNVASGETHVADASTSPAVDRPTDWTVACEETLRNASKMTPSRRLDAVIDDCRPCGDWTPLLEWNTSITRGSAQTAVEDAMVACNAFCTDESKRQFVAALAAARGKPPNQPWRVLGEQCKGSVSAASDTRFMAAPFFALDRIARAAATRPELAKLAAAVEVPLPLLSPRGDRIALPDAQVMHPDAGRFHVTVTTQEVRIGTLPHARLGPDGVILDLGASPYPGELVTVTRLHERLDALTGSPTARAVIIAGTDTPAQRLVTIIAAAGEHEMVLAAVAGGPTGWDLPGVIPVALDAKPRSDGTEWLLDPVVANEDPRSKPTDAFEHPRISIAANAKVGDLVKLLGRLAFYGTSSVSLAKWNRTR